MNIEQLESYNLADAVKFNDHLNPRLFGKDEHLLPEVRRHLLGIADDFREFLGVNGYELRDITISGSNAAYTYTPHSDIDLHLVVDLPQMNNEVYKELFDAKKYEYNDKHDIKISGYDVELYVQDVNQTHVSQGIYSVLNNDWVEVPRRQKHTVNDVSTRSKYEDVQQRIKQAIASDDLELMSDLKHKISDMRKAGLARNGEFGPENLAFKMLRTQGDIGRLAAALVAGRDRELSLVERRPVPVKYGFAVSEDYTKRLDWSSLDEGLSLEDKMSIFEEFYIKGNLTESIDQDKKEYFVSLFDLSTTPVKHEKYIVVPLSLVNNKIMPLDQPGYMEFLARAQDSLVFKSSHGQKTYPSDIMRDLSVFHTFTFSTAADYNKFRTALVLKFNTELPAITITNEDASISPDGVNPTTKMILEKERISTQTILADFVKFCSEQLGLEKSPAIQLRRDPEWSARNKTFGRFNTETGALEVSIGNRHVMDVLRTVAHELVHQRQSELEDMPDTSGETGSKYENQANALAGVLMRDYAELHPEHFAVEQAHGLKESAGSPNVVTRIDSHPIGDFAANMQTYYHTDDWRESGQFPKGATIPKRFSGQSQGVYAGDPTFTALYATGSSKETRYVAKYGPGQPIVWFDKKDLSRIHRKKTYLTTFNANNFKKVPSGEYFSNNPGEPVEQKPITDPFQYITDQGWVIRTTDNLPAVLKKLQKEKDAQFGSEGMGVEEQVKEGASGYIPTKAQARDPRFVMALTKDVRPGEVARQANKLGLQVDSKGAPALLLTEDEDNAVMLTRLGRFHPGKDTLSDIVPERQNVKYALHPDKWEATFYSLTNKDSDKLKFFGPKKIAIAAGTLVGDMAIANQFYRAKTPEDQQRYAEEYKQSLQPYPVDISQYRMPELLIPGDAEQLDELSFLGSPCTQDCSGTKAGYDYSKARGGIDTESWSPSFNNGAGLAKAGK